MAKTSLIMKSERLQKSSKFKTRVYSRCKLCGRPRGFLENSSSAGSASGSSPSRARCRA